jgi:hypothetical protein
MKPLNDGIGFFSPIPTSPFASVALCVASICSATRLTVCFVNSLIRLPSQMN